MQPVVEAGDLPHPASGQRALKSGMQRTWLVNNEDISKCPVEKKMVWTDPIKGPSTTQKTDSYSSVSGGLKLDWETFEDMTISK